MLTIGTGLILTGFATYTAVIDYRSQLITNRSLILFAIVGLGLALLEGRGLTGQYWASVGYGIGFAIVITVMVTLRSQTLGGGDTKFLMAIPFWVGLVGSAKTLLVALVLYCAFRLITEFGKKAEQIQPTAFGPYLCTGLVSSWFLL